jgi:hypothetical protein
LAGGDLGAAKGEDGRCKNTKIRKKTKKTRKNQKKRKKTKKNAEISYFSRNGL